MKLTANSFLKKTPDGRTWRIEVLGPGQIKATDIMSPIGYSEWISAEQARIHFSQQLGEKT